MEKLQSVVTLNFVHPQTCYEMERYLREEPRCKRREKPKEEDWARSEPASPPSPPSPPLLEVVAVKSEPPSDCDEPARYFEPYTVVKRSRIAQKLKQEEWTKKEPSRIAAPLLEVIVVKSELHSDSDEPREFRLLHQYCFRKGVQRKEFVL